MNRGLRVDVVEGERVLVLVHRLVRDLAAQDAGEDVARIVGHASALPARAGACRLLGDAGGALAPLQLRPYLRRVDPGRRPQQDRSEEHTSELQSLMRISYAVFCL